jgi:hypothetical protein
MAAAGPNDRSSQTEAKGILLGVKLKDSFGGLGNPDSEGDVL